jgi:hypothetical protein
MTSAETADQIRPAHFMHRRDRADRRLHSLIDAEVEPDQFLITLARRLGRVRVRARAVDITEEVTMLATVQA